MLTIYIWINKHKHSLVSTIVNVNVAGCYRPQRLPSWICLSKWGTRHLLFEPMAIFYIISVTKSGVYFGKTELGNGLQCWYLTRTNPPKVLSLSIYAILWLDSSSSYDINLVCSCVGICLACLFHIIFRSYFGAMYEMTIWYTIEFYTHGYGLWWITTLSSLSSSYVI